MHNKSMLGTNLLRSGGILASHLCCEIERRCAGVVSRSIDRFAGAHKCRKQHSHSARPSLLRRYAERCAAIRASIRLRRVGSTSLLAKAATSPSSIEHNKIKLHKKS